MKNQNRSGWVRLMAAALVLCVVGYALPGLTMNAQAAELGSALHFAEHGIKAYVEGWLYAGAGKGEQVKGEDGSMTRQSDCAGLLYAYFTDNKMTAPYGGATSQVTHNCAFSGDLDELDGIPRIHGLAVTAPDYNDPETGIYGHIGIYIGNGEAVDNSTYGVNMRRGPISERNWNAWHVFDNGLRYPTDGWYSMNGAMYHYTDYQYDVDTQVDGYWIGSDGIARDEGGEPIPVDNTMENEGYASASQVASYLSGLGYSGKDSTRELIYGSGSDDPDPDPEYNGKITGSGVNLRSEPNTGSSVVTNMSKGTKVKILAEVDGESISSSGQASSKWYQVVTSSGKEGYVSAWFAEYVSGGNGGEGTTELKAPSVMVNVDTVILSTSTTGGNIYFTTDGTQPSESNGMLYTGPELTMGCTYRAVTEKDGKLSEVTTVTVTSNGVLFTDVTDKDWFFSAVNETVSREIFNGSGTNEFDPSGLMTRAMLMTVLARLDGVDTVGEPWYAKGLEWAVSNGISDGSSPHGRITREQLVTMLYRYAGAQPGSAGTLNGFADAGRVSGYALDAMRWATENKIIQGNEANRVEPKAEATRAEVAVMMQRFLRLVG